MLVDQFDPADSFGPVDQLLGITGNPPQPGAERRYPFSVIAAALGGGAGFAVTPEQFGAAGDGVTDDTQAFNSIQNQALLLGGITIQLTKGRVYALNWTIICPNLNILGVDLAGEANVLAGFTAYSDATPCISIGDSTHSVENMYWNKVRVYSQVRAKGVAIWSLIGSYFENCEFGGFREYALAITSLANHPTYYLEFNFCRIFSAANSTGNLLWVAYGASFTAGINFHNCPIVGGTRATGFHAVRIGYGVDVSVSGRTWITGGDLQGVFFEAASTQPHGTLVGTCIIDGNVNGLDRLVEIPTNENTLNSFIQGNVRVNGRFRNSANVDRTARGRFNFAQGFFYGPRLFRPDIVGALQLVDTSAADTQNGPKVVCGGGPPPALDPEGATWARHSVFISVNNSGSSNGVFVYTENGWENVVTGGYVGQTGPNMTIGSAGGNAANTINLADYKGDYCYVDGTGPLNFLGTTTGSKRPEVTIQPTASFAMNHVATGPGLFLTGYRRTINLISGDILRFKSEGSNFWRLQHILAVDGRAL